MLASASMYKYAHKVKDIFLVRLVRVAQVIDMVSVDVDVWWELKVVVNFASTEVGQIKLETLEVEDEVVWYFFEARPTPISYSQHRLGIRLTFSQHPHICRTTRTCTCCRLP